MKFSLLALCTLALLVPSLSLKCYQCSSKGEPNCNDPFSPTNVRTVQCGPNTDNSAFWDNMAHVFPGIQPPSNPLSMARNSPVCIKMVSQLNNGQQQIVRDCSLFGPKICDVMISSVEAAGGRVHACESCQDELCNSAPRDLMAVSTALVSSIVLVMRSYF